MIKSFVTHYSAEGKNQESGEYAIIALNNAVYPITSAINFLTKDVINIFDIFKKLSQQSSQPLLKQTMEYVTSIFTQAEKEALQIVAEMVDEQHLIELIAGQLQ